MPDFALPTTVNPHFLARLLDLTSVSDVIALEDILDERGMRIVGRGSRVTSGVKEQLRQLRLKRPLEACIGVENAVNAGRILTVATKMAETSLPVGRLIRSVGGHGPSPLALLARVEFGHAMGLMMPLVERQGKDAFEHTVMVGLVSACLAKRLKLSEDDQMSAALAGLLHDIGELYIDPAWLAPGRRLLAHEWIHVVSHPRVGQMLVNELDAFPVAVGRAVAEHHERFNGSGYPRQVAGNTISPAGQAVSVAEMVAGLLTHENPLERAELALKIIPGEHAPDLLSAISGALRTHGGKPRQVAVDPCGGESVERLFWRISSIIEAGENLLEGARAGRSEKIQEMLQRTIDRIKLVQRAFISTGLDVYMQEGHDMADPTQYIQFEKAVATREIQWRLRDIARDLALHAVSPNERSVFSSLIILLDDAMPTDGDDDDNSEFAGHGVGHFDAGIHDNI
jgi:hypothetical protein